jgi:hypothetical protein
MHWFAFINQKPGLIALEIAVLGTKGAPIGRD